MFESQGEELSENTLDTVSGGGIGGIGGILIWSGISGIFDVIHSLTSCSKK